MAIAGVPEDLIEREISEDDSAGFTNTKYRYNFPYEANGNMTREYPVHDLDLSPGIPFISLYSDTLLTKKQAYFKFSIALSLYSLFEKEGFLPRPVSAIGGYNASVQDELYKDVKHSPKVQTYIDGLNLSTNSFQIQSRFTLSHAHSLMRSPESASIEFFKVVELYIKHCAYTGVFTQATTDLVLDSQRPSLFHPNVKSELVSSGQLDSDTVDVIFKLKNVRNKFIGHGGIRPTVGSLFGDPEDNQTSISYPEFQYDNISSFGEPFYEKVMYDIEVIAVLLFCKMNDVPPIYLTIPGCWWQPNQIIDSIMNTEGVERLVYDIPSPLDTRSTLSTEQ